MSAKAIRVALIWNGTVLRELVSRSGKVTVGENRTNDFVITESSAPASHVLIEKDSDGFTLNLIPGMTGQITRGDKSESLEGKSGSISLGGDAKGRVEYAGLTFFFQFISPRVLVLPKASRAIPLTLLVTLWFSFVGQLTFVFVAQLLWDQELEEMEYEIPPQYLDIAGLDTLDEIDDDIEEEEEEVIDETTSARAAGEEGRFGEEDAEMEDSILPDHDGPLLDQIETTELGRALDQAIGQSGALSRVFDNNNLMAGIGQDFATAGEGDAFAVGRGAGGMGEVGGGRGGGGTGMGRVGGVGSIDAGGGRGVSANMGQRSQRAPRASVSRGRAEINGFLSREQIERVVRRHQRGIRYCYETALQDDPELEGRIVANWTVDLDGSVSRRSIESNSMGNRDVESCILREVGRMRFPEPDGGMVVVSYPFTFRGVRE
ncbi:MAG: AgmX/PglI C-terminal domain-containing protein [Myxococcales bacterium]|nr:AgmX/PglI C-terminal domain-containing protein [Myxococcales bacterium]